ncbi:MAG: hypothetical protein M9936_16305 [Caldilinea sp.]|nr:hypothetical protein [Caldilinea sp.]
MLVRLARAIKRLSGVLVRLARAIKRLSGVLARLARVIKRLAGALFAWRRRIKRLAGADEQLTGGCFAPKVGATMIWSIVVVYRRKSYTL